MMQRWFGILFIVALIALGLGMDASHSRPRLSEHSQPAVQAKAQPAADEMVVVTPEGKLFHKAGCQYIHGKPQTMTMAEAIRQGYTPCTRCERELLRH